jgi:uncharacterized membrane protein (DUF106 family)
MPKKEGKPDSSPMLMMMLMMFMLIFLFDPQIRKALGGAVGFIFYPLIGFNGAIPVVTIFLAGLFTALFTMTVRHFSTDWMEMARIQNVSKAFQKELKDARMKNNTFKLKRLMEMQPEIMKNSMKMTTNQMRTMPITMIIVIPVFVWLSVFVGGLTIGTFSVPWAPSVNFESNNVCFFANWIVLYALLSIPFGQVLQRLLKLYSFRERIAELPEEESGTEDHE